MKWCCKGIAHWFGQRNYRTIFIFAEPPSAVTDSVLFWMGMRCVDRDKLGEINKVCFPSDIPVTIAARIPIAYCPWCGVNLFNFYRDRYSQLVDQQITEEFHY